MFAYEVFTTAVARGADDRVGGSADHGKLRIRQTFAYIDKATARQCVSGGLRRRNRIPTGLTASRNARVAGGKTLRTQSKSYACCAAATMWLLGKDVSYAKTLVDPAITDARRKHHDKAKKAKKAIRKA